MQISIVNKSNLDDAIFRIDAEYYRPDILFIEKKIKTFKSKSIRQIKGELDCSAFYPSITQYYDFAGKGIPFLRVNEISNGLVVITENTVFLPQSVLSANPTTISYAQSGDLIIAKGGNSLAKVGLVTEQYNDYSFCRDLIVLRTSRIKEVNRYYLWVFLHSKVGQNLLMRTASQTGQPHLTLEAIYRLQIPLFSPSFQKQFEILYLKAVELANKSQEYYFESKQILLSELGLLNWKPKRQLSFIKNFSDTKSNGRIDAEYFQPMYEEIVKRFAQYKKGNKPLGEIVKIKDKNFLPKDNVAYRYIELANISANGNINGFIEAKGNELPSRARRKVNAGDVIVSSIEGSLSSIALITCDLDNALCSTGFFVVISDEINSETLLVMLKSLIGQLQLKKGCSGTILTAISKDELSKIVLPKISIEVQKEIKLKITEMYHTKALSKNLLDIAKCGVEIAIEKDERTAMKWIEKQLAGVD